MAYGKLAGALSTVRDLSSLNQQQLIPACVHHAGRTGRMVLAEPEDCL